MRAALVTVLAGWTAVGALGDRFARKELVERTNEAIAGRIDVGTVQFTPPSHVVLRDVELFDPEGSLVARLGRAELKADLDGIARKRLRIDALLVADARLHLVSGPAGLNLAQAVAPRAPAAPPAPATPTREEPSAWTLDLAQLLVTGLALDHRPAPGAPPDAELRDCSIAATARLGPSGGKVDLTLTGSALKPLAGPIHVVLAATTGSPGKPTEPVRIDKLLAGVGASRVRLAGTIHGREISVRLDEVLVARSDVEALAPGAGLAADLALRGTAGFDGSKATMRLELPSGPGSLVAAADAVFSPSLSARAAVEIKRLDLARLFEAAPPSELNGRLDARFDAGSPEPGRGRLDVSLRRSQVRGSPLESLEAQIETSGQAATVQALRAVLPGGTVSLSGRASAERLDLKASLDVADLGHFAGAGARMAGAEPPQVAGRGRLVATVEGPPRAPSVELAGDLARLAAGSVEIEGVRLSGQLPDASRPSVVRLRLGARRGSVGGLGFLDLAGEVQANGRSFGADLSAKGLAGLSFHLAGEIERGERAVRLDALDFAMGGDKWSLAKPALVEIVDGARVDGATLTAGRQRLTLRGGISGTRLDAALSASGVDLARLPPALAPAALKLAGLVDLEASVRGTTRHPEAAGRLAVRGLSARGFGAIDLSAAASSDGERAKGTLTAERGSTRARATFDLPLQLFGAPAASPLLAKLEVAGVELAEIGRLASLPDLKGGDLSADVELSGTAGEPTASLAVRAADARWAAWPKAALAVGLSLAKEARATASVVLDGGKLSLDGRLPLSLAALARKPPTAQSLASTPLALTVEGRSIDLGLLTRAGVMTTDASGVAQLDAQLEGTAERPRGTLVVTLADAAAGPVRRVAGRAELSLEAGRVAVQADATVGGKRALSLAAAVAVPLEKLSAATELDQAPVDAKLLLGPVGLAELSGGAADATDGALDGELSLTGTLARPELAGRLALADVRREEQHVGSLEARVDYRARRLGAKGRFVPVGGGLAELDVGLDLDLGLPALRAGLDADKAPLSIALRTDGLDLALLDGLSERVRRASGTLKADASVGGTVGDPSFRGRVLVERGRVSVAEYGSYQDVALDLKASDTSVALKRLFARSGAGTIELTADATRASTAAPFQLTASLKADRFPITRGEQVMALLTGSTESWTGQIQGTRAAIEMSLGETVLTLPQLSSKSLQPLEPNPDVVVLTGRRARPGSTAQGGGMDLSLRVRAPRDLRVESSDLKIELGMDLAIRLAPGADLALTGDIETKRGSQADVLGKKFEVQRGRIGFTGPAANPNLDIVAVHENVREKVKVRASVSGTAQKPKIDLTSEPPLEEAQIVTLLATGRRELKRGSGGVAAGGGAVSVLGNVVADRMRKTIAKSLPLDKLEVDIGEGGIAAAKIEAGTYVTDRIYVGYRHDLGAQLEKGQNSNEVRVEYQVSPRVTLETQYGDANRGGADVVYTRDQ